MQLEPLVQAFLARIAISHNSEPVQQHYTERATYAFWFNSHKIHSLDLIFFTLLSEHVCSMPPPRQQSDRSRSRSGSGGSSTTIAAPRSPSHPPPPSRYGQSNLSHSSRGIGAPRSPSHPPPPSMYGPEPLTHPRPLVTGPRESAWRCEDCQKYFPVELQRTVIAKCCKFDHGTQVMLGLCAECQCMNWEHFMLRRGSVKNTTESQVWQDFCIWMYHFKHCRYQ